MKKTYINPNIEIIKIASQSQMLAGSLEKGLGNEVKSGAGYDDYGHSDDFDW